MGAMNDLRAAAFLNPLDPTDAREIVRRFLSPAADRRDPIWTALVLTALATLSSVRDYAPGKDKQISVGAVIATEVR